MEANLVKGLKAGLQVGIALDTAPPLQLKFKVILMKLYRNTKPPVYWRIQVSHGATELSAKLIGHSYIRKAVSLHLCETAC